MRHLLTRLLACLALSAAPLVAGAAPHAYALETDTSVVGFAWTLGPDTVKGTMPVKRADMVIDFDSAANTHVAVALDVTGAVAGFPFATQGMKSRKVLWADRFPEITFESTAIRPDDDGAEVDGLLTVRGITRPVTFRAQLYRQKGTQPGDRRRLAIVVTGSLSRAAFGADGWSGMAGDRVDLTILARIRREE
ncbi:hypothetical protein GQ651_12665 [Alphaproteobacteria bacterium GH1-50]|uniref:Lipid/polyisoprenoid-binding YceI-like domain-containing protein n=1 Tax=Kangsaoukella pontilimi TaxID=2691042 RepID=A0A7C9J4B5_9RHOB|nr:YceI family protein [Kangsaoukella pontilimi]MXQ08701.1 hypothetical protein [Kangsaoukella pontilimi]